MEYITVICTLFPTEAATGGVLYQSLFFNKVEALGPATLLKERLLHSCFPWCFPVTFAKFLRTPFY